MQAADFRHQDGGKGTRDALLLCALFVLQAMIFYTQIATHIAPYYPTNSDQTKYLFDAYSVVTTLRTEGVGKVLSQALHPDSPNGAIFPLLGAMLVVLTGLPRAGALTVNLLGFMALEAVLFWFVRQRTGRNIDAWIAVALILLLHSPFFWAGGLFDFRIDFIALCQFGLLTILILHSGLFRSLRWSIAAGLIAAWMGCTRYISFAYFAPVMALVFVTSGIIWLRTKDSVRRADTWYRVRNIFLTGAIASAFVAPFLWSNRSALYHYYFVGLFVSEEKEFRAKEMGISTLVEHLLYYPKSLLFGHLGISWLYVSGALIAWLLATAALLQRRSAREIWAQIRGSAPEFWFLAAVLFVPLLILNTSIHKSPVVVGILCVPATLVAILIITALRNVAPNVSAGYAEERGHRWLNAAAAFFGRNRIDNIVLTGIVVFGVLAFSYDAAAPKLSLARPDQIRVNELYDKIVVHIIDYDSESPKISIDRTVDYSPNKYNITLRGYEKFGRLLKIEGRFGGGTSGLFATSREDALKMLSESSIIVLTDKMLGRDAPYPMNKSVREYWDEILDWTAANRILIYTTEIQSVPYRVFVKPYVKISGLSGEWVTSAGLSIDVDAASLVRWPYIVLEGTVNYDTLGGEPGTRAVIIDKNGRTSDLPAIFKRTGPLGYQIVIDGRHAAAAAGGPTKLRILFDRFFVPSKQGINADERELVLRAPLKYQLRAQPPLP